MPFGFRRRSTEQFKHIAHGLVPAATVAPRSAVPRTPPPRSPNPSPERPRSALAAAILMTSLTGRTVAMPQLRMRSFSESDSFDVKQESFIEPYATAAELGLSDAWRDHRTRFSISSSPDLTNEDSADEEEDKNLSESERESSPYIAGRSNETESVAAIYALPDKTLKINRNRVMELPPPPPLHDRPSVELEKSQDSESLAVVESERSSPKVVCLSSAHLELQAEPPNDVKKDNVPEIPRATPRMVKNKRSLRRNITEEISSDVTDTSHQKSVDQRNEIINELKSQNQFLEAENQTIATKAKELKRQLTGLSLTLKELGEENRRLKDDGVKEHREEAAELLSLREQAQELVDENDALKMTVHRLNVELSRYQTKYRPLSQDENTKIPGLPMRSPPPPWLLDMKYLSPLLLAYEDRMREKDSIILAHEEEMRSFRARVEEVVHENDQLHEQLGKNRPVTTKEWRQLQLQAKLVLEENQVLMKQCEVQQAKAKESHNRHIQEVSKLTKQLMLLETKKASQDENLSDLQKELDALHSRCNELKLSLEGKITAEDHVTMVNDLKRLLKEEKNKGQAEVDDLMRQLSTMQAEKKSLLLEKNSLQADNKTLEEELEITQKNNRKGHKKIAILKQQLEETMEKEIASNQYLANLVSLAENITIERDQLVNTTKSLQGEKLNFLNKLLGGHVRLGRLEEKVKVYRKKAALKLEDISHRLSEQEDDFAGQAVRYQREMKHLQRLLLERQDALDRVLHEKREVEGELEVVWETTSSENKRIKALLAQSPDHIRRNPSKSPPFYSDEIPQKESVMGIPFSD